MLGRWGETKNNRSPEVCIDKLRYDPGWVCNSRHRYRTQVTTHAFTQFEEIR